MTESTEQRPKVNWLKSLTNLALLTWGLGTYFAVLAACAWFAVAVGGDKPNHVAVMAVGGATWINWLIYIGLERFPSDK